MLAQALMAFARIIDFFSHRHGRDAARRNVGAGDICLAAITWKAMAANDVFAARHTLRLLAAARRRGQLLRRRAGATRKAHITAVSFHWYFALTTASRDCRRAHSAGGRHHFAITGLSHAAHFMSLRTSISRVSQGLAPPSPFRLYVAHDKMMKYAAFLGTRRTGRAASGHERRREYARDDTSLRQ